MDLRELAEKDPKQFQALARSLNDKLVIPHEGGQQAIMADDHRFQIVCCGRRFGKTVVAAKKALRRTRDKGSMVWWVAPTYAVVKRGYREVLRQLPDGVLDHVPPQESAFDAGRRVVLRFKNGARMEFYSAERPEGMLGEGVDFVVLDEAARIGKTVWNETIRPTLVDRQGGALMISTPRGRNWFYYEWLRGQQDDHASYASWRFPTSANPHLPPEEIEEMRKTMPLLVFQQEVLAEFVASAGQVFRWSPEAVTPTLVKPQGHVFVGVDLAKKVDFTVFYAANEDGLPCGFDRMNEVAWKMQRNRLHGFVKKLKDQGARHVTLVMDSTGVGDPIVEEVEAAGYDVIPVNFRSLKQNMVTQLSKDLEDGYARLLDHHIEEFENYTYEITASGNFKYSAPEGQHDDVVSAKMLQHWGLTQEGAPNVTAVSAADEEPQDDESPEGYDVGDDDWSDLIDSDGATDTGVPEVTVIRPDSAASIMAREGAWA